MPSNVGLVSSGVDKLVLPIDLLVLAIDIDASGRRVCTGNPGGERRLGSFVFGSDDEIAHDESSIRITPTMHVGMGVSMTLHMKLRRALAVKGTS